MTMAASKNLSLSLAFLAIAIGISQAFGSYNCCIKYDKRKIPATRIESYYRQDSTGVCNINAVVFEVRTNPCKTTTGIVCVDPNQKWVNQRIEALDKRTERSKKKMLKKLKKKCRRRRN
ncbi:C-C motif chemokine 21-like [Hyperolius riggenbachi]|uniref:C-C motif chemokine 21-like n=1 Tax=Hyperolius riggenbachi TaxID=752182 RepID=UPI0035A33B80